MLLVVLVGEIGREHDNILSRKGYKECYSGKKESILVLIHKENILTLNFYLVESVALGDVSTGET